MTRERLVRDTAAALATARAPSEPFRLARRLDRLGPVLAQVAAAEGRRIHEAELAVARELQRAYEADLARLNRTEQP